MQLIIETVSVRHVQQHGICIHARLHFLRILSTQGGASSCQCLTIIVGYSDRTQFRIQNPPVFANCVLLLWFAYLACSGATRKRDTCTHSNQHDKANMLTPRSSTLF